MTETAHHRPTLVLGGTGKTGPRSNPGSERPRANHRHSACAKRRPSVSEAVR
jgi:hypothetical protein